MDATLERLLREIDYSLRGLDAGQTQLRPPSRPNRWSIQQIMEHLLLTYSETAKALDIRISKGRPTQAKPTVPQRIGQYTVIRLGYFPTGRKAPPISTPAETLRPLDGAELVSAAREQLGRLDTLCTEAGGLFGCSSPCASHLVLGPLTVDQWRKFQLIHGEHHLKQILGVRKAHGV